MTPFKYLRFLLLLSVLPSVAGAQTPAGRLYATQEADRRLMTGHRELLERRIAIENHVSTFGQTGEIRPLTIPVVFHIVQSGDMPGVSTEQVTAQLEALNRHFGALDPAVNRLSGDYAEFIERAAAPQITFCLSDLSAAGRGSTAILYTQAGATAWSADDKVKSAAVGGSDPVDTRRFLNIWVCDLIGDNAGYAQMPGGPAESDGVVIDIRYFGLSDDRDNPFREGKTLTHLIANYLGLYDLWNEFEPCFDDRVYDTPVHNDPNAGAGIEGRHISTCFGKELEMYMNYLDNTEDSLLCLFTRGQVMRMQAMLSEGGPRHGLVSDPQCDEPAGSETLSDQSAPAAGDQPGVEVFPNPAESRINIAVLSAPEGEIHIEILNAGGQRVWHYTGSCADGRSDYQAQCADWPEGLYTVTVRHDSFLLTKQVIVH